MAELPEVPIEAERGFDIAAFDDREGHGVTQTPILVIVGGEKLPGALLLTGRYANHG